MKLTSLTICRNSAWCIRATITHALKYCDQAVVLVHASEDDTAKILVEMGYEGANVIIMEIQDPAWDEMTHRQTTLELGRRNGGTHFVILDDDEMMAHHLVPIFRDKVETLQPGQLLRMPMRCCWRDLYQYRSDPGNPFTRCQKSVVFADAPELHWKDDSGYQHHHTHPYNCTPTLWEPEPGVGWMHFQHADWERLLTKQTWYMCMELCRWGHIKANYRGTMDEKGLQTSPVPDEWISPEMQFLDLKAEPWQAKDILLMVRAQGLACCNLIHPPVEGNLTLFAESLLREKGVEFFNQHGVDTETILNFWNL